MTVPTLRPLVILFLALCCGCGSSGPLTYLWVDVEARPGVHGLTRLEVTVTAQAERLTKTFDEGGAPFSLPTSLTVTPPDGMTSLSLDAQGYDADGIQVARGSITASIEPGVESRATLTLEPFDFQVNTTIAGDQIVTDIGAGRSGRQVSSSDDGRFIVVYENIGTLGRYDGLGRLFDGAGLPLENAVSRTDDDFVINQGGQESVFYIAVAAAPAGGFLSTWRDATAGAVLARPFDAGGNPSDEVQVSAADASDLGAGHAAALSDGGYVVVWSQGRSGDQLRQVHARLLDGAGAPRQNGTTGDTLDFPVGVVTTSDMLRPAVAVGPNGNFLITWVSIDGSGDAAIHAQLFSGNGVTLGNEVIVATAGQAEREGPNVASTSDGYLLTFTSPSLTENGSEIYLAYLTADGFPPYPPFQLATSRDGEQVEPAVAVGPDDTALVVWTDEQGRSEDNDRGSIRGRALHPFGLPMGADFGINTTTNGAQTLPSVAAAADGAFVVMWQDDSASGPDVDLGGVRARLIYLDPTSAHAGLGATCNESSAPCHPELTCVAYGGTSYCHTGCAVEELGQPCSLGGICTSASVTTTPNPVCLFR